MSIGSTIGGGISKGIGKIVNPIKNIINPPKQTPATTNPSPFQSITGNANAPGGGSKNLNVPSGGGIAQAVTSTNTGTNQSSSRGGGGGGGSNLAGAVAATNAQSSNLIPTSFLSSVNQNQQVQQAKIPSSNPIDIIKRTASSAGAAIVSGYNTALDIPNRQTGINQQAMNLQGGVREESFTKSGRGTIIKKNIPYTEKELINAPVVKGVSSEAVNRELARREQAKIDTVFNKDIQPVVKQLTQEGQQIYNEEFNRIQSQVDSGQITLEEANKMNEKLVKSISESQTQKLQNYSNTWMDTRGKQLSDESKKHLEKLSQKIEFNKMLSTLPITFTLGVATGGIGAGVASTGPIAAGVVRTAGVALTSAYAVSSGVQLGSAFVEGTLTPYKIANVVIPAVAFIGGASVGSKIVNPKIDTIKLKSAMENADVVSKTTKGITSEVQINALKISQEQKAQLIGQLRAGSSIKEVTYKLEAKNSVDQKLINKVNPEIRGVQVITQAGNKIDIGATIKVKTTKGLITKKEDIIVRGQGETLPEGKSIMDILTIRGSKGKALEVSKTRQFVSSKAIEKEMTRAILGRSMTAEISTKAAKIPEPTKITRFTRKIYQPSPKGLTIGEVSEVARGEMPKQFISKSKFGEFQELVGVKLRQKSLPTKEFDIGLAGVEKIYKTKGGRSVSSKLPKPFEYEKISTNKAMKELPEQPKIEQIKYPKPKTYQEQVETFEKQFPSYVSEPNAQGTESMYAYNQNFLNRQSQAGSFSNLDLSNTIKSSISGEYPSSKGMLIQPTIDRKPIILNRESKLMTSKELDIELRRLTKQKPIGVNLNRQPLRIESGIKQAEFSLTTQSINQQQKQIEKQIQKLQQVQPSQFKFQPGMITELETNIITPPSLFGMGLGGNVQYKPKKLTKEQKKQTSQYTASLAAAALQVKPIKVTRKQYEQLSKQIYTGIETRPVLEITEDQKQVRKAIKKVKF